MITIKIDVCKISKERLYVGKNGAKYLNAVLIETPDSQYDSHMIVESTTKEERAAGIKGKIIGNGKELERRSGGQSRSNAAPAREESEPESDNSIPF